jgi:dTDP-glucose 4,6-dehydratase
MNFESKKVLVTGAGGFLGSHLVERLIDHGSRVRCFIRYNSRNDYGLLQDIPDEKIAQLDIVAGDLRDANAVHRSMQGVDVVFHLGSLIAIPYSYVHPVEVIETNVIGTLNVMLAARDHKASKVVHTSTSEVYGTALYVPIDEKHPLQAQSPYSASKIGADKIVESIYDSYTLPVATIRPFNIYGPRQSARAVIPTIINQALTQEKVCLGNINPTRDYTYVTDTVEAFIRIAESDDTLGKTFNVGSNLEISIGSLAEKILELTGRDIKIIQDEKRMRPEKSEVERLLADNTAARKTFGWEPNIPLKDGLQQTIDWISNHLDRYKTGNYVI